MRRCYSKPCISAPLQGIDLDICCAVQNTQIALVTSLVFLAYLYFAFYFFNIRRANRMLANESYAKYKQAFIHHLPIYH